MLQVHKPGRARRPVIHGTPKRPKHLKGEARRLWDQVVPELTRSGILTIVDSAALVEVCEVWALIRATQEIIDRDPLNSKARRADLAYFGKFLRLATRLGMTPLSRHKMRIK